MFLKINNFVWSFDKASKGIFILVNFSFQRKSSLIKNGHKKKNVIRGGEPEKYGEGSEKYQGGQKNIGDREGLEKYRGGVRKVLIKCSVSFEWTLRGLANFYSIGI
jgi:hypothetical protein